VESNAKVVETPGLINSSPYDDGWLCKIEIKDPEQLKTLMNEEQYKAHCKK
jgi:glycine cleavage system H protein